MTRGGISRWAPAVLAASLAASPAAGRAGPEPRLASAAGSAPVAAAAGERETRSLRLAIEDLIATFGPRYPKGPEYLARLDRLVRAPTRATPAGRAAFDALRRQALLANPLLGFDRLLVVERRVRDGASWKELGLPDNHRCNSTLPRLGYENRIAAFSAARADEPLETIYRPEDRGYVGEVDLDWDAQRLLFTRSDAESWKVWELELESGRARRVCRAPADVDCFDACYLPDGGIVFGSTAPFQSVPCWHGRQLVSNLYRMEADGSGVRRLCHDQDHDFHPCVLEDGQVIYHRWDYTGVNHVFQRELMVISPDGTGQRAVYGTNSWYPNALYFPRPLPGAPGWLVSILSGYHGVPRMGQLVLIDTRRGWRGAEGLVRRISGKGEPIHPLVRDRLVDGDWPKFLHPWPLGDKYFLVSAWPRRGASWGIWLADVFDNLVLLREEPGSALLEPVPLVRRPRPPVIGSRVDPTRDDGVVYLQDVYRGGGLSGVPRGEARRLRIFSYHFGYPGLAGPDKVGYGGPWEVMRILGTVDLADDGSALFRAPALTPLSLQVLDGEGQAIQWMRSWFTLQPGETRSCTGCHESPREAPPAKLARAATSMPVPIEPWHGPARGFDFAREVQPVLDRHCVRCHDGEAASPDLRRQEEVPGYAGRPISRLGRERLHPAMLADTGGILRYTPAYDALIRYVRRVGIEDDVEMLVAGEVAADTSELVQLLEKGHGGVRLDPEGLDRIVTWIDLNAPCHGTWGEVYPIPDGAHDRRMALGRSWGGPSVDPERIVEPRPYRGGPPAAAGVGAEGAAEPVLLAGWPFGAEEARRRQQASCAAVRRVVELGAGVRLDLAWIPAGEFVRGDAEGLPDERPPARVRIARPFWAGVCEVTNAQFGRFDPSHSSRYYARRHARSDDRGLTLDEPDQPAVRVSWKRAMEFCRWLSRRSDLEFTLPSEEEWEYACRAGSATPLWWGDIDDDFSRFANLADRSFGGRREATGGVEHLALQGAATSDLRHDDGQVVTSAVGSYAANPWGLRDVHGNAAEWTRSLYRPYAGSPERGGEAETPRPLRASARGAARERRVVRGGSFFTRPARARSAWRIAYPPWRRVFDVGFRVIARPPLPPRPAPRRVASRGERATPDGDPIRGR